MTAYTGVPMMLEGYWLPVIVDLQGLSVPSQQRPILRQHDQRAIVAHTDAIEVSQQRLKVSGVMSGVSEAAREVMQLADNGFPWQASIGARPDELEFVEVDSTVKVNGRNWPGPLYVARKATLGEISFVPVGADQNTNASIAAQAAALMRNRGAMMDFDKWTKGKGFDPAQLSDGQRVTLEAAWKAESTPPASPPPAAAPAAAPAANPPANGPSNSNGAAPQINAAPAPFRSVEDVIEAQRHENARRQRITEIVAGAIQDRPDMVDVAEGLGRAAIEGKQTEQWLELQLLRAARPGAPLMVAPRSQELNGTIIECAVAKAAGIRELEKHYKPETLEASHRQFRHGLPLGELLLTAARRNGYPGLSLKDTKSLLKAAFRDPDIRAAGISDFALPNILGAVANKSLVAGFNFTEQVWRTIAKIKSVPDFKTNTAVRLSPSMKLETVGADGQLKHGTAAEATYTVKANSAGLVFAVTRQDIINDDMSALNEVPMGLGRGAGQKLNTDFWTVFLNNSAFFTTARGNYFTGAATNLQSSSLATALGLFRNQTSEDGEPLGIEPRILLVPTGLEVTMLELMRSTNYNTGGAATDTKVPNTNIWAGRFTPAVSAYLANAAYTGNSAVAWYLLADPNDVPVICVAFVDGVETPQIDSTEANFDQPGITFRALYDYGVNTVEYRGGVKSKGAA
jgi:hypothetical protein